jgi:alpha-glucosidase
MHGHIFAGDNWLELIKLMTSVTGRPSGPLPRWSQLGAVVGLEGGTENVTKIVNKLLARGVPLAGVWLQDWVGMRHAWDGDRLIWNWEVNYDWYPGWDNMVLQWASLGTRVLTYISPFFSDPRNFTSPSSIRHNFYEEGINNGYFVQMQSQDITTINNSSSNSTTTTTTTTLLVPYTLHSLSIEFCMLDTTNPAAVTWMKNIIKNQLIQEAHSSGFMCDFGEYLPFDAVLNNVSVVFVFLYFFVCYK